MCNVSKGMLESSDLVEVGEVGECVGVQGFGGAPWG